MIWGKKKSHDTVKPVEDRPVEKQAESVRRRFEAALDELEEALRTPPRSKPRVYPRRNNE